MIPELRASDKFGAYRLWYENRIMRAVVTGAIGTSLSKKFVEHVSELFTLIPDKTFGYLGDLSHCEGYTAESEPLLSASNAEGMKRGCFIDAYLINSPVAAAQIKRVRQGAGIDDVFESHLFQQETQALDYLYAIMADIDNR